MSIVSISPLFIAILDRTFYKTPMKLVHLIGFIILIVSSSLISLAKLIDDITKSSELETEGEEKVYKYQPFVPVILAVILSFI